MRVGVDVPSIRFKFSCLPRLILRSVSWHGIGTCISFIGTILILCTSFGYAVTNTSSIRTWASVIFVGAAFDQWEVKL
jgi:hypothetical protein